MLGMDWKGKETVCANLSQQQQKGSRHQNKATLIANNGGER